MQSAAHSPQLQEIPSNSRIVVNAVISGFCVLLAALALQWVIYHDLLHRSGLRIVGSLLAGILTSAFSYRWQCAARQRKLELLHSLQTIAWANDRIRNALQAITCITYFNAPEATDQVAESVEVIERVLKELLARSQPGAAATRQPAVQKQSSKR